jgi:hypothetical protein
VSKRFFLIGRRGNPRKREQNKMAREFTQEHILKICLPPELYMAVIQFQAKQELGKSYAGLLLVTKALYQEKLICREAYEKFLYRYSRKIVPPEEPMRLTAEQLKEKQKLDEKTRTFSMLPSQWDIHPSQDWRKKWIMEAEKWQDKIPEAREFLRKHHA